MPELGTRTSLDTLGRIVSVWVDPSGGFWYAGDCGHETAARTILGSEWFPADDDKWAPGSRELERRGWAHISYGRIILDRAATDSQRRAIADMVRHIVMAGMTSGYQRDFISAATPYVD